MANIQTIRLIYYPESLSEKEYIKTFLEFIGFQILEEPFQTYEEFKETLNIAGSDYDLDIWLNLKPCFFNDDNAYISAVYYSRAKNVIAIDYYFSEIKDSQEYSVSAFSKKSRKIDKIYENVESKEELKKRVLEKLVEQLWYGDTEKQEDVKIVINSYVKHNIFVCLQSLTSLSLAGMDDNCNRRNNSYVHPTEFWEFCIKGFANFFNELQPVSKSLRTVYTLYAYTYAAIIYHKLMRATQYFYTDITLNINPDYASIISLLKKLISIDKNFVGNWHLAIYNSNLCRGKEFEIREYLYHIIEELYGNVLNDKFASKYFTMMGDYFEFIGGNYSASHMYYEKALSLNKKDIRANIMIACNYHAQAGRYSTAETYLLQVLDLLCSPHNKSNIETTNYEILFKTNICLAKVYYNWKKNTDGYVSIENAIKVLVSFQNARWINKIIDDEEVWKVLKEHYKNGAPTQKLYNILYGWTGVFPMDVNGHLKKVIEAIKSKRD